MPNLSFHAFHQKLVRHGPHTLRPPELTAGLAVLAQEEAAVTRSRTQLVHALDLSRLMRSGRTPKWDERSEGVNTHHHPQARWFHGPFARRITSLADRTERVRWVREVLRRAYEKVAS